MSTIYDNYLDTAFGEHQQADFKVAQFQKNYLRFFPEDKQSSILDIGPGRGEMLTCLKQNGYQNIKAIDLSPSIVNFCNDLGFECELVEDTQQYLEQNKEKYNMITMCDVLEHIPKSQTISLLIALRESLTSGGFAVFQTPNMQSPDAAMWLFYDFTHEFGYTEHSITQALKISGFSSIYCSGFEFLDDSIKSKSHRVLRNLFWKKITLQRKINGKMPHKILNPVFFAIAKK